MKPSNALIMHKKHVKLIIAAHHAGNPRIFGSVSRGEDIDGSDLDILVDPGPDMTMFDIGALRSKLALLLGVPVDVLTPHSFPETVREKVLLEAKAL